MSYESKFGDLTVYTGKALPLNNRCFTIPCHVDGVTLDFGELKSLRIRGKGKWTHCVLFWQGALTEPILKVIDSLPEGHVIYQNRAVTLIHLKNDSYYGCLEFSLYLDKGGEIDVRNNISNTELMKLDTIYEIYNGTGDLNKCLNLWVDAPIKTDLKGTSGDTQRILDKIYEEFTRPLLDNPDKVSDDLEKLMAMAHPVSRIVTIREIIVKMFQHSILLTQGRTNEQIK